MKSVEAKQIVELKMVDTVKNIGEKTAEKEKVIELMNRYKFWECYHTEGTGVVVKCDYVEEDPEDGYKREGFRIDSW